MKWQEVRELYPNQYVLLKVLKSRIQGNKEYIEDMEILRSLDDPKEATKELLSAKNDTIVYHTANKEIIIYIRQRPGLRGVL